MSLQKGNIEHDHRDFKMYFPQAKHNYIAHHIFLFLLVCGNVCNFRHGHIYQSPTPWGGGGHGPLCPFSYASDSGVARNIQQGAKGVSPSQGREL